VAADYQRARYASLQGSGVLITGGASGIGAEMVRAFAAQGARVHFIEALIGFRGGEAGTRKLG